MRELCNHSACNIWETKNIAVAYRHYTEKLINKLTVALNIVRHKRHIKLVRLGW